MDPNGKFIYALDQGNSGIAGFAINGTTGALTTLPNEFIVSHLGFTATALAPDPAGNFLYASVSVINDEILSLTIHADGSLTPTSSSPFNVAAGQPGQILIHPSGKFLYTPIINNFVGIDAFSIDSTGALTLLQGAPFSVGNGLPNSILSMALDPAGHFLYALDEINGALSMSVFAIDSSTGVLTQIQGSPFPADQKFSNGTGTGAQGPIVIDPAGKLLYVGCGNPDMEVFSIDASTGALTAASASPFQVNEPSMGLAIVSGK